MKQPPKLGALIYDRRDYSRRGEFVGIRGSYFVVWQPNTKTQVKIHRDDATRYGRRSRGLSSRKSPALTLRDVAARFKVTMASVEQLTRQNGLTLADYVDAMSFEVKKNKPA